MELNIKILSGKQNTIRVQDCTDYLSETASSSKVKFKYSETASITIAVHNKINNEEKQYIYTKHTGNRYIQIPLKSDGWFKIIYVVLPTKEWFINNKQFLSDYSIVYFLDDTVIHKYVNGVDSIVSIDEVINVNTGITTVSIVDKSYISTYFLMQCYIDLCRQIFNDRAFSLCKSTIESDAMYKRDLTWMAINVIKYLTQTSESEDQLVEVERLIESLQGCNGLCSTTITNKSNGCGCSKK